jgi:hypothetical protein
MCLRRAPEGAALDRAGVDSRLTDGGKIVSPTHRPRSTTEKPYFSASDIHFCSRLCKLQSLVRPERLGKLKQFVHLIGSRNRVFPACSIVA